MFRQSEKKTQKIYYLIYKNDSCYRVTELLPSIINKNTNNKMQVVNCMVKLVGHMKAC